MNQSTLARRGFYSAVIICAIIGVVALIVAIVGDMSTLYIVSLIFLVFAALAWFFVVYRMMKPQR